jgi:uncharacterized protein (DUF433 family)
MHKTLGKYIESDTEKGSGEWRFIGTRIAVADALHYVAKGKKFEDVSKGYNALFPPEAVAEAVELAAKFLTDEHTGREHRRRRTRKIAAV